MYMIFSKLFSDNGRGWRGGVSVYILLLLVLCSTPFLPISCATRKLEMPSYEGIELKVILAEKENIRSLSSTFSIEFEKDGSMVRGDAVLKLRPDSLDLQVYSLGLLVAEVSSVNDVTKSVPAIDKNRLLLLIDGLRNSFLWWSMNNPEIRDDGDIYHVSNSWKRLFINKKTMLPVKQIVELENGRQLNIFYDDPVLIDGIWFPSKMRIELSRYSVNLKIKTLSVNTLY